MLTSAISPVAPIWLAAPVAVGALLLIASHILAIQHLQMPDSRRRIRTANGLVMLLTVPVLCYAASMANGDRIFVLSWMAAIGLIGLVVLLAMLDALNNARIHFAARRELRGQFRAGLSRAVLARRISGRLPASNANAPRGSDT